jgi:Fe-Mn family superoxide dismutase
MPLQPGTYTLGPENGTLSVRTGRTGAAAKAGHDLLIHVTAWEARVEVGEDPARTTIVLDVDGGSLRVREGTGGMQPLGPDDRKSIQASIDDEILHRRAIAFRSTAVDAAPGGDRLSVRGDLTLVDTTAPVAFDLVVSGDTGIAGSAIVKQSDWGITPYSALFGALKVVDEVEVAIDADLLATVDAPIPPYEAIRARALKPALLQLDGISRVSVEAHHRVYRDLVQARNEILGKLGSADAGSVRELKAGLAFAVGGIKNHELYFEHLGGAGGDPDGAIAELIERDFGSAQAWRDDLRATGMAARGWACTAYDWESGRLSNWIGDAPNAYPVWHATPLVVLDVEEHAYFVDFQTDRAAYVDAFFANLDWAVVNGWIAAYGMAQSR